MKRLKLQFLIPFLSAVSVCAHAQEGISFTVEAPRTVTVDEVFSIAYILNTRVEEGVEPHLSSADGITPTMGPMVSRSSSTTTIGGVRTDEVTTTYTWYFRAEKSGDLSLPYCRVETGRGTWRSESLRIKVLPNGDEPPAEPSEPNEPNEPDEPAQAKSRPDPVPDADNPTPDADPTAPESVIEDIPAAVPVPDIDPDPTYEPETQTPPLRLSDKTRKGLLYTSIILLALLSAAYITKLNAKREAQYAAREQDVKTSPTWHLPFLAAIIALICCIAALW